MRHPSGFGKAGVRVVTVSDGRQVASMGKKVKVDWIGWTQNCPSLRVIMMGCLLLRRRALKA